MKKNNLLNGFLLIFLGLSLCACSDPEDYDTVSLDEYNELKNKYDELQEEHIQLQTDYDDLERQVEAAEAETKSSTYSAPAIVEDDEEDEDIFFENCSDARSQGYSNIYEGEPGYRSGLDRDGDGVACES